MGLPQSKKVESKTIKLSNDNYVELTNNNKNIILYNKNQIKKFEGMFENDIGRGIFYDKSGTIMIECNFDMKYLIPYGDSKIYEKGLIKYNGMLHNGMGHGFGTEHFGNGNIRYVGGWKFNKKDGNGIEYHIDNYIEYDGEFRNNKKYGYGKLFNENGKEIFSGFLKEDNNETHDDIDMKEINVFMRQYQKTFNEIINLIKELNNSDDKCCICLNMKKEIAIRTCGHLCLCLMCGNTSKKCPICRKKYDATVDLIKIYV